MYDFTIGIFESIVKHGLSWSTAAAVLFLILKQRAMKRKLKRYLPFMFKDEDVNPTYVSNQKIIMENQRRMMERMGLECAPTSQQDSLPIAKKKRKSLSSHSEGLSAARGAVPYTNWRMKTMSNINKGILIPLLSAIALFVKEAFGYEVPTETIDMAANIILYLIMAAGLFMNFKKKKAAPKQQEEVEGYYH